MYEVMREDISVERVVLYAGKPMLSRFVRSKAKGKRRDEWVQGVKLKLKIISKCPVEPVSKAVST